MINSKFEVIVGNVGMVHQSDDQQAALEDFFAYAIKLVMEDGRAEVPVTFWIRGELVHEFDQADVDELQDIN